jgi:hypothetical protein
LQPAKTRPEVEALEARLALSGTPTVDLTTAGALGSIPNSAPNEDAAPALFKQTGTQPTGCGVIGDFLRIQAHGAHSTIEQGFNSDARPVQFDEQTSPTFTRSLHLNDLPTEDIGGVTYRVFLLGVNQKSSSPLISLDELRFYVGATGDLTGYDTTTNQLAGSNAVYDMGVGNWVKLDASLTHGNGSGDMLLYVPDALFTGGVQGANPFVYLYSKFGVNYSTNGGFEQWAPASGQATAATGVISGKVTCSDLAAEPLADVLVFLDANGTGVFASNDVYTYTKADGTYSFNNLGVGFGTFSTYAVGAVFTSPSTGTTLTAPEQSFVLTVAIPVVTNVNFTFDCGNNTPPPN